MIEFLSNALELVWTNGLAFIFILSVIVFGHEMGHYLIARYNGVRVEVFSIGFGPEIFGWNGRSGTRWKISLLPLGGYVKMFGDANAASTPSGDVQEMTPEEREVSFFHKRLGQRTAIVAGGPLANFILAIIIYAGLFMTVGERITPSDIGEVIPGSPAEAAGFMPGDLIVQIDNTKVDRFEELQSIVRKNAGVPLTVVVVREGAHPPLRERVVLHVTPGVNEEERFGSVVKYGLLGVKHLGVDFVVHDPFSATLAAVRTTGAMAMATLQGIGDIVTGRSDTGELGGPIRIAQVSKGVAEVGMVTVFNLMALLSINLGLINLFPIPMLDGGHLLLYAFEAVRGKPLGERLQEYCFRIGLAMVLSLMIFATWNDLVHLKVVEYVVGLFS